MTSKARALYKTDGCSRVSLAFGLWLRCADGVVSSPMACQLKGDSRCVGLNVAATTASKWT